MQGAQGFVGVVPDMAVFAKSVSNGYPMGMVVGKRDVMAQYRTRLRAAHPDHGGDDDVAAHIIERLGEARRILLGK